MSEGIFVRARATRTDSDYSDSRVFSSTRGALRNAWKLYALVSTCYVYSDWLELGARSGMYWRLCAVVLQCVLGLARVTRASHDFWAARGAFGNRWRLYALVPNCVFGESDPRRTSSSVPARGLPTPNFPPSSSSERALLPCTTRKQKHKAQEVGDESLDSVGSSAPRPESQTQTSDLPTRAALQPAALPRGGARRDHCLPRPPVRRSRSGCGRAEASSQAVSRAMT